MDQSSKVSSMKVKMFFFPHTAGGHLLPLIDIARSFASHPDAQATIITTSKNVQFFQKAIDRDREAGHDITVHTIMEPPKVEDLSRPKSELKESLLQLLKARRPDFLVSDLVQAWTLGVANELGIPWIVFHSTSLFALCAEDSLTKFKPQRNVGSDTEPFVLDGLPDKVQFTRLRLPDWHRNDQNEGYEPINLIRDVIQMSYAVIANSSYELEGSYHVHCENVMGKKIRMVGPVSLSSNRNMNANIRDGERSILKWLDTKKPNSALYISFGTNPLLSNEQFHEIAHGLEASGYPFIWMAKASLYHQEEGEEGWLPEGFEERMKKSNQGLIINGWAPQLLILSHANVGAFMTHCGWNSSTEGLSNGVPMITWPLMLDQFFNESFLVDVLKVGIRVGNEEWISEQAQPKVTVTRDKVEVAVRHMMTNGKEVQEMRRIVKQYAKKCKIAVEEGGSSHQNMYKLVEELKTHKNDSDIGKT